MLQVPMAAPSVHSVLFHSLRDPNADIPDGNLSISAASGAAANSAFSLRRDG
jgi:hypothetical protein